MRSYYNRRLQNITRCYSGNAQINWYFQFLSTLSIQILSRPFNYRRPRVILLSSFFTWAGGKHEHKIAGSWNDFKARVPVIGAAEEYLLENGFYDMLTSTGADACIVGLGLVYGGSGFDMEDLFR